MSALLCKNDKAFWKEIKLMNNSNLSLPNVVDGITGSNNIVNMWKSHYEDLFHCLKKDTNDNFWQAISVFMFHGECTVNLNNLFSKPSTPILTWTNPRQSFLGNYDYASHFTYDNSSVSVRFHFLDLHLPSSASVWSVLFGFSTM